MLKNRVEFGNYYYEIEMILNNNRIKVNAFLDTGNTVHEPYNKKSVIFVEGEVIRSIMRDDIYQILLQNDGIENIEDEFWKKRIILLPISTVSEKNNLRIGLRMDKIIINTKEGMVEKNGIAIVICEKISRDGSYSALIGEDLLSLESK